MSTRSFSGFDPGLIAFLEELAANNNREWFEENRHRYEGLVQEPALAFIEAMQSPLARISSHFVARARRSGGSLMRVYRDTRFARDKAPYKTNVGIQFRHAQGRDVHAPGYYVHIAARETFLGVGMWHPDSASLKAVREAIVENPQGWKRARDGRRFRSEFVLGGQSLRRPPRGFDAGHAFVEDLKRKDFIAVCELGHDVLESPELVRDVSLRFAAANGFMRFLCEAMGVPF